MPKKESLEMAIKALEQEPCGDCCNGNQIEKAKLCQRSYLAGMEHRQKPKTGHWIVVPGMNEQCSKCGKFFPLSYFKDRPFEINYCPDCGAKMQEVKE